MTAKRISLTVEEWSLVRAILKHGFIREPHANWLAAASEERRASHRENVAQADAIVAKIDTRFGL